ncbi:MAG: hypothetical protein IJ109_02420 [Firmicutes bacterium]|nr:hypothetical protein [Bacillota bacterium]
MKRTIAHILIILLVVTTLLPWQTGRASAAQKPAAPVLKTVIDSGSSVQASWDPVTGCSGYQVQCAGNRLFLKKQSVTVAGGNKSAATIKVSAGGGWYVRIRAYTKDSGGTAYSEWSLSGNAKTNKTVSKTRIKKNRLKSLELRRIAKQKVPGFDTLQGSCYAGGYVYYLLENRNISYAKGRCKIVKMKLSNKKVVKVSAALKLSHGNDITFDTKRNRIVVAHSTPVPKQISVVNPKSLKVTGTATVEIPYDLYKLPHPKKNPEKYINAYNGFGAIAYNKKHDQFVALLRGSNFHHMLILNSAFQPVRFEYVEDRPDQTVQGIDSYDDYVIVAQSYSSGKPYNQLLIYSWDEGDFLSKLNLGRKYELESVFHTGSAVYAGFYTSFYKKKLKKGKKRWVLQRDNYLYKLSNL